MEVVVQVVEAKDSVVEAVLGVVVLEEMAEVTMVPPETLNNSKESVQHLVMPCTHLEMKSSQRGSTRPLTRY